MFQSSNIHSRLSNTSGIKGMRMWHHKCDERSGDRLLHRWTCIWFILKIWINSIMWRFTQSLVNPLSFKFAKIWRMQHFLIAIRPLWLNTPCNEKLSYVLRKDFFQVPIIHTLCLRVSENISAKKPLKIYSKNNRCCFCSVVFMKD